MLKNRTHIDMMRDGYRIIILTAIFFVGVMLAGSRGRENTLFKNQLITFEHIPSPNFGIVTALSVTTAVLYGSVRRRGFVGTMAIRCG